MTKKLRWGRKGSTEASTTLGSDSNINNKNALAVIDSLQGQHKKVVTRHRLFVYRMMADAASVIVLFRKSKGLEKKFKRHAKLGTIKKGIATEVLAFIMQATTMRARQLAWKRARVIDYLLDQGVKPAAIKAELKQRGGLEAVCKLAALEAPRRSPKSVGKKKSDSLRRELITLEDGAERETQRVPVTIPNNRWITIPVRIRLSEQDALNEMVPGSKAIMKIARIQEGDAQAKVLMLERDDDGETADW
jgi:hypothetical protein